MVRFCPCQALGQNNRTGETHRRQRRSSHANIYRHHTGTRNNQNANKANQSHSNPQPRQIFAQN
jgi:hypothetical protein